MHRWALLAAGLLSISVRAGLTAEDRVRNVESFDYVVEEQGGATTTFTLESAYPHRILAWRSSGGESGRILGSARLAYWKLNGPGGEAELARIGLKAGLKAQAAPK